MSNPILNQMNQGIPKPNNSNPLQMVSEFKKFAKSMQGKNPEQMVMNLLNSGEMSKEQFNSLLEQAKSLQGLLKM